MVLISKYLPSNLHLKVSLTKRRRSFYQTSILPYLKQISGIRKGNKISRFFRFIFENERIKNTIGKNLAILVMISSLFPNSTSGLEETEINLIKSPIILNTENGLQFPVRKIRITQSFRFYHQGIDLDGEIGDAIFPIMSGKVEKINHSRFGYGKSVIISHGNEFKSLYAHLSKIEVSEGQEVTKETKIGEMGATGQAFGDHLHLEVYEEEKPINPLSILPH